jgi:hypothetical protein
MNTGILVILDFVDQLINHLKSVYGNLPYIAPEAINGKGYTTKSDVYSIVGNFI